MNIDTRTYIKAITLFWSFVLVFVSLVLSLPADAADLEIGTGYTYFVKQTDGVWYQEAYPYWMDQDDQSLSLGVSWKPAETRYRAEFLTLGKHAVNAIVTSDGTYNPYFVANCNPDCGLVSLVGRGSVSGVVLSASKDFHVFGLPFYAEGGIYANVKKWQVNIGPVMGDGSRPTVELAREHQLDFGPVIGVGFRYGSVDVGVRYVYLDDSSEDDPMTPMMTGAYSLMFKAYF